ncbi:MAG: response regulator [Deltaproteobacteria bacterium]|nr:MAG: response regulator [Deltaproteobacteria bacterium]
MNILIVDDNEQNLYLERFLLEQRGHTIREARDAEQAFELIAAEKPELIVMDVGLPGMNGLEATRRLKADAATADIPVIACTAHSMVGDESDALAAGCAGYISKPIDPASFVAAIEEFA